MERAPSSPSRERPRGFVPGTARGAGRDGGYPRERERALGRSPHSTQRHRASHCPRRPLHGGLALAIGCGRKRRATAQHPLRGHCPDRTGRVPRTRRTRLLPHAYPGRAPILAVAAPNHRWPVGMPADPCTAPIPPNAPLRSRPHQPTGSHTPLGRPAHSRAPYASPIGLWNSQSLLAMPSAIYICGGVVGNMVTSGRANMDPHIPSIHPRTDITRYHRRDAILTTR
jgi:hypothetical protein